MVYGFLIAFPERNPGVRRKRVFPPLPHSFQFKPITTLVDWQAPRSFYYDQHSPGAGRRRSDEQLAHPHPQTTVFLQPRNYVGYILIAGTGQPGWRMSYRRERWTMVYRRQGMSPQRHVSFIAFESELYFYCRVLIPRVTGVLVRI